MAFKFGCAPCSWGIEDPKNPDNPPWQRVLDETVEAGYKGTELGQYGYLPPDRQRICDELQKRNLTLTAGTLYDDLHSESAFDSVYALAEKTCELISANNQAGVKNSYSTPFLVIIDAVSEKRSKTAGHFDLAPRLSPDEWAKMVSHIVEISKMTWQKYGVRSVVHPHAGGYIEFADEIDAIAQDIPYDVAGLCLDSGHLYYSDMDPAKWYKKYQSILDYVHFKDVNEAVYRSVLQEKMDYFSACKLNVMCPIGAGSVNYEQVLDTLREIDYKGWITIEQERDPKKSEGSLADVKKSLNFLENIKY